MGMIKKSLQRGFTLIEVAIVLAIFGVVLTAISQVSNNIAERSFGKQAGSQLKEMIGAGSAYMSANVDALVNGTPIAGVANPMAPTFAELKALGYIGASTPPVSEFGSTWNFGLTRRPVGCVAPACDILVAVNANDPVLYKGKVNYEVLKRISDEIGNDASYSTDIDPANIHGMNDSWAIPNPASAVPGIIMARAGFGSQGLAQFVRNGDSRNISINGGLSVNGVNGLSATKVASTGNLTVGGAATVAGATTATGGITVSGTGVNANTIVATTSSLGTATATSVATSTLQATGATTLASLTAGSTNVNSLASTGAVSGSTLQGTTIVTPDAACSPDGVIAQTGDGSTYSCRSGKWISTSQKPCVHGSFEKTAAGSFILNIPLECKTFTVVEAIGGGGSGASGGYPGLNVNGNCHRQAGGGGASGSYLRNVVLTNSSGVYNVTVGAGGTVAKSGGIQRPQCLWTVGNHGGATSISASSVSFFSANGGYRAGGDRSYDRNAPDYGWDGVSPGFAAWTGPGSNDGGWGYGGGAVGGNGGASPFGAGGIGGVGVSASAPPATAYGAGGAGGALTGSDVCSGTGRARSCNWVDLSYDGSDGRNGYIKITW